MISIKEIDYATKQGCEDCSSRTMAWPCHTILQEVTDIKTKRLVYPWSCQIDAPNIRQKSYQTG